MRKELVIFLFGVAVGSVSTVILYKKKEKLLKRIRFLELRIQELNLKENVKEKFENILSKLKLAVKRVETVSEVEKDKILKEVVEKIRELEAIQTKIR